MKFYLLLCLSAVLVGQSSTSHGLDDSEDSAPETVELRKFQEQFFKLAPAIIRKFMENMPSEVADKFAKLMEINLRQPEPSPAAVSCGECIAALSTLTTAIKSGMEYDSMVAVAEVICRQLMDGEGYHGDIICPGAVGNFAPHVVYILNVTEKSSREICTQYNHCTSPGSAQEWKWIPRNSGKLVDEDHKPKKSSRGEKRSLEGALKLVHLNDIHMEDMYTPGASTDCGLHVCCKDYNTGGGSAGIWGDWKCNTKPRTAEYIMEYISAMNPDLVINAGDNPPNTVWEETQERQLQMSHMTAKTIERIFPGIPAYAAIGNHDMFPVNLYYSERPQIQEVNMEFYNDWSDMSGFGLPQLQTIRAGGWYSVLFKTGLRIITINTNMGHTDNYYNILNDDKADNFKEQVDFLHTELEKARTAGEKVILIGHHPSGASSTILYFSHLIRDIGLEYGDIIVYYAQGHSHGDSFRMVVDKATNETKMVQLTGPAITSYNVVNPSARVVYLDPVTFEALDYDQYYLDLPEANAGSVSPQCPPVNSGPSVCTFECELSYHCLGLADRCCPSGCGGHICLGGHAATTNPEIKLAYRFTEEYGVPDATPASFGLMVDKMEADESLHDIYRYHSSTQTRTITAGSCTGSCHSNAMCRFRTSSVDDYRECTAAGVSRVNKISSTL